MKTLRDKRLRMRLSKPMRILAHAFMDNIGRTFTMDNLIDAIWGCWGHYHGAPAVRVDVCRLRKKLASTRYRIETVREEGYRMVIDAPKRRRVALPHPPTTKHGPTWSSINTTTRRQAMAKGKGKGGGGKKC